MAWKVKSHLASAHRHGISAERIEFVVTTCRMPMSLEDPEQGEEDVLLFLAPDQHGVPIEVLGVELPNEGLVVFHAMKVARKNRLLYNEVMR